MDDTIIAKLVGRPELVFKGSHRWPEYVGLEMELERGEQADNSEDEELWVHPRIPLWSVHNDQSLRNGVEYVFSAPYAGENIVKSLDSYYSNSDMSSFVGGPRTSTHIHVNMLDVSIPVLQSMIVLVYAIESALYNVIGEGRKWAGYSAALEEIPTLRMRNILKTNVRPNLILDYIEATRRQERYYGFNLKALMSHGSVEFRYFYGAPERHEVEEWLDLVVGLKKIAKLITVAEMREIVDSEEALVQVLQRGLSDEWINKLRAAVPEGTMYSEFSNCISLCSREDDIDITQDLLRLKPKLVEYIKDSLKSEDSKDKIDRLSRQYPVISLGNLQTFLSQLDIDEHSNRPRRSTGRRSASSSEPSSWTPELYSSARAVFSDLNVQLEAPSESEDLEDEEF